MSASSLSLVLTTCGSEAEAARIGRTLVEERLAACVNRLSVQSCYSWEEAIHDEAEQLLIIKTLSSRLGDLKKRLMDLHSYEVPEFVVLEATDVSEAYLAWVREAVGLA